MGKASRTKKSLMDRPRQFQPWIGLGQIDRWRRDAAPPNYAARGFAILNSAGNITRQQYLEMMYDMERDYPGHGWQDQGAELYAWYGKRKLNLKDLPAFRDIAAEPHVQEILDNPKNP